MRKIVFFSVLYANITTCTLNIDVKLFDKLNRKQLKYDLPLKFNLLYVCKSLTHAYGRCVWYINALIELNIITPSV